MRSYGRKTIKVRTDYASEVTADYLRAVNTKLNATDRVPDGQ